MNIAALHEAYAQRTLTPEQVVAGIYDRIEQGSLHPVWISLTPREQAVARAKALAEKDRARLPLYGVPFAVKDTLMLPASRPRPVVLRMRMSPAKAPPWCGSSKPPAPS